MKRKQKGTKSRKRLRTMDKHRKDQEMERERSIRKAEDEIKVSEFGGLVVANICLNSGFSKSWQHWETFLLLLFKIPSLFLYGIYI